MTKKFYRQVLHLEILSEDEPLREEINLENVIYVITWGHRSGRASWDVPQEVQPQEMAKLLLAQGSDPEFFGLMLDNCNSLSRDHVCVQWTELGEGLDGDYNPNDPEDVELLRFDVLQFDDRGEWEAIEGASYCTLFLASATEEQRRKGLEIIMNRVHEPVMAEQSIKAICQELSWISLNWVKALEAK